jgi:hypothetical protein
MPIFKKDKGVDVLDYTRLQKKGLLKVPEKKDGMPLKVNSQGYVDLGVSSLPSTDSSNASNSSNISDVSALGFLDSLASSTSSSNESYFGSSSGENSVEIAGLKNKIEDLEYKIRVLEDKIAKLDGS